MLMVRRKCHANAAICQEKDFIISVEANVMVTSSQVMADRSLEEGNWEDRNARRETKRGNC